MQPFEYNRAATVSDAYAAAAARGAVLIAGGTELLNWMKDGSAAPARLVDISGLKELDYVRSDTEGLRIGALARMSAVAANQDVQREYPALAQALEASASQQIRNMASMAGNLLQRTRCPYFRAEVELPCNKRRPGSGCSARDGEDRTLAIFGGSEQCIATHPSDAAVALAALGAGVAVQSAAGTRELPLEDLYRLPGDTPEVETMLAPGDMIIEIIVPHSAITRRSHYLKLRERASYEFALVSAAAAVELQARTVRRARLVLGGVAPMPWRLMAAEQDLAGVSIEDAAALQSALGRDFVAARPGRGNGFKIELARRAAVRALQMAAGAV
jgi:xanthine dehydrogenase YagS FAD-binding subunit